MTAARTAAARWTAPSPGDGPSPERREKELSLTFLASQPLKEFTLALFNLNALPLRALNPAMHSRPTRTRRDSSATPAAASAAWRFASLDEAGGRCVPTRCRRSSRTCRSRRPERSSSCSWPAAPATSRPSTPSRCSTGSTASRGQPSSARRSISSFPGDAQLLGSARRFTQVRRERHRGVRPVSAHCAMRRRHRRHPLLPRRHGGPLGGAVRTVHRPGHAGLPEHGLVGAVRSGHGEPVAAGLRRDARPARARSKPASRCTRNGFLPAVYQPTMFPAGQRPVLNLDLPAGVTPAQRRKTLD